MTLLFIKGNIGSTNKMIPTPIKTSEMGRVKKIAKLPWDSKRDLGSGCVGVGIVPQNLGSKAIYL
jgi:hypothetical protein